MSVAILGSSIGKVALGFTVQYLLNYLSPVQAAVAPERPTCFATESSPVYDNHLSSQQRDL